MAKKTIPRTCKRCNAPFSGRSPFCSNRCRAVARFIDPTGKRYGRMVALYEVDIIRKSRRWAFRCDCGEMSISRLSAVQLGRIKSCGCAHRAKVTTHGKTHTPEYSVWGTMRQRCLNPKATSFEDYGGRGILICERWDDFEMFLTDMGPRPSPEHSIDRVDNNGNYEPDNCQWSTFKQQAQHRRSSRTLAYNGETMTVSAWAERLGISCAALSCRLEDGWSVEKALTTPVRLKRKHVSVTQ